MFSLKETNFIELFLIYKIFGEKFRPRESGNSGQAATTLSGDKALSIIAFSSRPSILPCFSTLERAIRDTTEKKRDEE